MAHGFPDYVTSNLKHLRAPRFQNVTPDVVRTAEGQMSVQRHFNVYDRSGYHRPQSDYQDSVNYQEPSAWFEGMDRMMAQGTHFVREAGESFFVQMEEMTQQQAYQPEPMTPEMYEFFLQQFQQLEHEQTYQGQLEAMEPEPLEPAIMGMHNEAHAEVMPAVDHYMAGPVEELAPNPTMTPESQEPEAMIHSEGGSLEDLIQEPQTQFNESLMTLDELIQSALSPEPPNPDMDDPMEMFFPGMGPG